MLADLVALSSIKPFFDFQLLIYHCFHYVICAFYFLDSTGVDFKREILRHLA